MVIFLNFFVGYRVQFFIYDYHLFFLFFIKKYHTFINNEFYNHLLVFVFLIKKLSHFKLMSRNYYIYKVKKTSKTWTHCKSGLLKCVCLWVLGHLLLEFYNISYAHGWGRLLILLAGLKPWQPLKQRDSRASHTRSKASSSLSYWS